MIKIEFKFNLGDIVTINQNKIKGKVNWLMINEDKIKWYSVKYVDKSGVIQEVSFKESELTKTK
jgi:hypothetical protein